MVKILNNQQIKIIFDIAIDAGKIAIESFYEKQFQVFEKNDYSKVTSVDIEISNFIAKNLKINFPNYSIICEEGNKILEDQEIFFLIDPIDGTNSFIAKSDQFTINIALIFNNQPIFGLIYAPLFEGGKLIFSNELDQVMLYQADVDNLQFLSPLIFDQKHLRIITSKGDNDKKIVDFINKNLLSYDDIKIEKFSSAIKFIIFALGRANLYLHFKESMEWDTASGHFLLEKLGAKISVFDFNKNFENNFDNKLFYRKNNFINPSFLVSMLN